MSRANLIKPTKACRDLAMRFPAAEFDRIEALAQSIAGRGEPTAADFRQAVSALLEDARDALAQAQRTDATQTVDDGAQAPTQGAAQAQAQPTPTGATAGAPVEDAEVDRLEGVLKQGRRRQGERVWGQYIDGNDYKFSQLSPERQDRWADAVAGNKPSIALAQEIADEQLAEVRQKVDEQYERGELEGQSPAPATADNADLEANTEERAKRAKARIQTAFEDGALDLQDQVDLEELVDGGDVRGAMTRMNEIAQLNKGPGTRYRANEPVSTPIEREELQRTVEGVQRALGAEVPVQIIDSLEDIGRRTPEGGSPAGALIDGQVYLIRRGIPNGLEGEKTIFHELLHKGLRKLLSPKRYVETMNKLYDANPRIRQLADAWRRSEGGQEAAAFYARRNLNNPDMQFQMLVAHSVDEALAQVAEQLKTGDKVGSARTGMVRALAKWLADVAQSLGFTRLAQRVRSMTYTDLEKFVQQSLDASLQPDSGKAGTAAFKEWFGDSKVVDKDGKPLVLYHGSTADITKFSSAFDRGEGWLDQTGIYFTDNPGLASVYAKEDGAAYPVHLSIQNPFDLTANVQFEGWKGALAKALFPKLSSRAQAEQQMRDGMSQSVVSPKDRDRLLAAGYDGIKGAGGVWIAFRPEQVKSATGNNGNFDPANPDIRYRNLSSVQKSAIDALNGIGDGKVGDLAKRALHSSMFLRDLAAKYGDRVPAIKTHVDEVFAMGATEADLQEKAAKVQDALNRLNSTKRKVVTDLMADATAAGVYADDPDGKRNSHVTTPDQQQKARRIRDRFNALLPEQKEAYRVARDALRDNWKRRGELLGRTASEIYDPLIEQQTKAGNEDSARRLRRLKESFIEDVNGRLNSIKGDYFPEMRFGDYVVVRKSEAFKKLSDEVDAAFEKYNEALDANETTAQQRKAARKADVELISPETQERLSALRKEYEKLQDRLESMKSNEDSYLVEFFESKKAAIAYAKEVGGEADLRRQRMNDIMPVSRGVLRQMEESLELTLRGRGNAEGLREAKRALFEVYLQSLPDLSALKRQAKRKNVAGFSRDMQRSIASAMLSDSFHLSRLEHMDAVQDSLNAAWERAKGDLEMREVVAELDRRHVASMKYTPTPVQDLLSGVGQVFMLGISPGYLIANALQPWMVSAPMLVARHGRRALTAMGGAYGDVWKMVQKAAKESGLRGEIDFEGAGLKDHEVQMLNELLRNRLINVTLTGDLNAATEGKETTGLLRRGLRFMSLPSHHFEVVNRISTALAAYRMEMQSSRGQTDKATAYAKRVLADTHFDYSSENAPYWMKPGVVAGSKLLFQFKKYQAGMISMYAKTIAAAIKGGKDERAEARRMLTGLFITHGAMTGALGLPAAGSAMFIAQLVANAFGDDEPVDVENALRNWLLDVTGDKALANALAKGLPSLIGADLSDKVGAGNLVNPAPTLRTDKNGRDLYLELLATGLGPVLGGLGPRAFEGAAQISQGNFFKGLEGFLPKFASDALKAARFAEEGVTTRRGVEFISADRLDGMDLLLQAMGIPAIKMTDAYQARADIEDRKRWINETTTKAKSAWVKANKANDSEARDEAWQEVQKLNTIRQDSGFKPITRSELLQYATQQRKQEASYNRLGANVGKNERLAEMGRFATAEE